MYFGKNISWKGDNISTCFRVFSLTWPKSMQIYLDKKNRLQKKRVQFPQDWFGTPIWPPWCHVKTLYGLLLTFISALSFCQNSFAVILIVPETMRYTVPPRVLGNMFAPDHVCPNVLDCKTVGFFFSKSVKKSVKRGVRGLSVKRANLEYAKIRTVLQPTNVHKAWTP